MQNTGDSPVRLPHLGLYISPLQWPLSSPGDISLCPSSLPPFPSPLPLCPLQSPSPFPLTISASLGPSWAVLVSIKDSTPSRKQARTGHTAGYMNVPRAQLCSQVHPTLALKWLDMQAWGAPELLSSLPGVRGEPLSQPLLNARHQEGALTWDLFLDPSAKTQWLGLCSCSIESTGRTGG